MKENINVEQFPAKSGVYKFISNNEIIYVGSSKNLHKRFCFYIKCIEQGHNNDSQKDLYKFLQENDFTVEFDLVDNYQEIEGKLITKLKPRFNKNGVLGIDTSDYNTYHRLYLQKCKKYKEEHTAYCRNYNETHKEYFKKYWERKCLYNGKEYTLVQLSYKFRKEGISKPTTEAKKYLIK